MKAGALRNVAVAEVTATLIYVLAFIRNVEFLASWSFPMAWHHRLGVRPAHYYEWR